MRARNLRHRVTYVLVFDSAGRLFVQKRTPKKDVYPGFYDLAAGGVVCVGETYEQSAVREVGEELGITDKRLNYHFKVYFEYDNNRCWGKVFSCVHDGPFVLQTDEVESGEFVELERIDRDEIEPVTPDTRAVLQRFLSQ